METASLIPFDFAQGSHAFAMTLTTPAPASTANKAVPLFRVPKAFFAEIEGSI